MRVNEIEREKYENEQRNLESKENKLKKIQKDKEMIEDRIRNMKITEESEGQYRKLECKRD